MLSDSLFRDSDHRGNVFDGIAFEIIEENGCSLAVGKPVESLIEFLIAESVVGAIVG